MTGFFERIISDPRGLLSDIFRHIGISTEVDWDRMPYNRVIHKGVEAPMPEAFRRHLETLYRPKIDLVHEEFGPPVAHWLGEPYGGHVNV